MNNQYHYIVDKPSRSYDLARQMMPVLIFWAQQKRKPLYYSTLSGIIGHKTPRISKQLDVIGKILDELRKDSGRKDIPWLNALVINKSSKRPSDGLDDVIKGYALLGDAEKMRKANELNEEAYAYQDWPWVLEVLGLEPYSE